MDGDVDKVELLEMYHNGNAEVHSGSLQKMMNSNPFPVGRRNG
jgi:hypothetical protein